TPPYAVHEPRAVRTVDRRQPLQPHHLLALVNARCAVHGGARVPGSMPGSRLVIRLAPPGQYVGVVDAGLEHGVFLDHAATFGAHDGRKHARMNPKLLGAVAVEIEPLDHESLAAAPPGGPRPRRARARPAGAQPPAAATRPPSRGTRPLGDRPVHRSAPCRVPRRAS